MVGAFHAPVLGPGVPGMTDAELARLRRRSSKLTLMPYSYFKLSSQSGYGAGNARRGGRLRAGCGTRLNGSGLDDPRRTVYLSEEVGAAPTRGRHPPLDRRGDRGRAAGPHPRRDARRGRPRARRPRRTPRSRSSATASVSTVAEARAARQRRHRHRRAAEGRQPHLHPGGLRPADGPARWRSTRRRSPRN